ncbi:MAG: SCO family protein [Flavobacteriales bacterium]|nr:SCO family protein [Flavobacteriales bacterium]
MQKAISILLLAITVAACSEPVATTTPDNVLPIYGRKELDVAGDTIYHQIGEFSFTNQDGESITMASTGGEVYVADYFFTHCPTMCPAMTGQMKRVRKALPQITILTHTCDPKSDSVAQLKRYTEKRDIDVANWHFLTGTKEQLYKHGFHSYMMSTDEDVLAPGGFLHSPYFALVDRFHRIRGMYDGTTTEGVDQLIIDARKLIESYQ